MQISEIKELTTDEIRERIEAEQATYQQKRIDHYVSPAENPAAFREQRRTIARLKTCLLYTSPSPRDVEESRMPSSA